MIVVLADDVSAIQNTVKHNDAYHHCGYPEAVLICHYQKKKILTFYVRDVG
jgi:hypothetical protein